MNILFKLAFKDKAHIFMDFRSKAFSMSEDEYKQAYIDTAPCSLIEGSDLNEPCFEKILREAKGEKVLDVGAGRGLLAKSLAKTQNVTACDVHLSDELKNDDAIATKEAFVEKLPFEDDAFDTVICTHVLEHVLDIGAALRELRRVTKQRLIVVVPKERPYLFGFNLHLTFFPYEYSVLNIIGAGRGGAEIKLSLEEGDWFYIEDTASAKTN